MIPVLPGTPVIKWCGICNAAPADGILEILRTGEVQTDFIDACNGCVKGLNDDDWL